MLDWSKVKYFKECEFVCSCGCGKVDVKPDLVFALDELRERLGRPLSITKGGGYRCRNHPDERDKALPGAHSQGMAVDIANPTGESRYRLKKLAYEMGFVGIGHGKTFTHLDVGHANASRPADWSY